MGNPGDTPDITVALPVLRATGPELRAALGCVRAQTLPPREVLVVLNGSDEATRAAAHEAAARDRSVRVFERPEASLAAALNLALEAARSPLVARMDADDTCPPERFAVQARRLAREPGLAGVGCAYEVGGPDGRVVHTVRPPTDARRMRWSLLVANPLAHGSMMLRRHAVLACPTPGGGRGYDTSCARAQDYELWLRLSARDGLAAVPEVLYRHRLRSGEDPTRSTPEQAAVAGCVMLRAWSSLPPSPNARRIASALAAAGTAGVPAPEAIAGIESILDGEGPSREGLLALLWARAGLPSAPRTAMEAARRALVREAGRALREAGAARVWLWGAGDHTRRLLEHASDLGLPVAGIVDDAPPDRERFGLRVVGPDSLGPGDHVLISSDWHEEAIWAASAPHRARGVRVVRLYGHGRR